MFRICRNQTDSKTRIKNSYLRLVFDIINIEDNHMLKKIKEVGSWRGEFPYTNEAKNT